MCLLLQRYTFWSNSQQIQIRYRIVYDCACYCKDTHFEAIHNVTVMWSSWRRLCLLLQRYTFWSNSQHQRGCAEEGTDCACYCKDTHFEAIHNQPVVTSDLISLCLLLQRYTFWSNSQRNAGTLQCKKHCACYCKDTHFEAIHNRWTSIILLLLIVLATAKIHILKQFTTFQILKSSWFLLCLLLQRYTFWSNSQHRRNRIEKRTDCACYCKDTHFEAIHNRVLRAVPAGGIVLATAKIHILKQFTTLKPRILPPVDCACYCKDTHFEAIHNKRYGVLIAEQIVLATAKIHILKQFTTIIRLLFLRLLLCLLLQRYTFWSNSQLYRWRFSFRYDCACYCKDTHFEAIHNCHNWCSCWECIVLATAKIHILKQFTTSRGGHRCHR